MRRALLLLPLILLVVSLVLVGACSDDVETTSDGSGGDDDSSGPGVFSTVTSAASMTGMAGGGAGEPLACFGGFVTNVPVGTCDVLNQDCPAGMGCEPMLVMGAWETTCVPHTGVKDIGDPCFNSDSCRAGLHCVIDKCAPLCCDATNEPCGVGGACNVPIPFAGGTFSAQACSFLDTCTLFAGDCDAGQGCYVFVNEGKSACAPLGTGMEGGTCENINDCADSMICSDACRWACFLDDWQNLAPGQGGCPMGQSCVETGPNPPQNVGVCAI